MLTNNGKAALKLMPVYGNIFNKGIYAAKKQNDGTEVYLTGSTGTGSSSPSYFPFNQFTSIAPYTGSGGINFGTGSTAATVNDYCLESRIEPSTFSASVTSSSVVHDSTTDTITITSSMTYTNNQSTSVTIGEIGYAGLLHYSQTEGGSNYSSTGFLLDRTVLSTPITVPAGDTVSITYSLSFSYNF